MAEIFTSSGDKKTYSVSAPNLEAKFVPAIDKRSLENPFGYVIGWGDGKTTEIFTTAISNYGKAGLVDDSTVRSALKAQAAVRDAMPATPQFDFTKLIGGQGQTGLRGPRGPQGPPGVGLTTWKPTNWVQSNPVNVHWIDPGMDVAQPSEDISWGDLGISWFKYIELEAWPGVLLVTVSGHASVENHSGHERTVTMWLQLRPSTVAAEPDENRRISAYVTETIADGEEKRMTVRASNITVPIDEPDMYTKWYVDLFGSTSDYGLMVTQQRYTWIVIRTHSRQYSTNV